MRSVRAVRPRRVLFTAASAALAIGLMAGPAVAATWTISPGGSIAVSGNVTMKDTRTGTTTKCGTTLNGTMKSGSGLSGTDAGSITGGTFGNCSLGPGSATVKLLDLPWRISLTSYRRGVVHGTISHMEISVSSPGCSFVIDGTRGGASNGMLDFTYTDSTGTLNLLPAGGNLHAWDVTGCFGLINNGDPISITGTFHLSPKQTITSP